MTYPDINPLTELIANAASRANVDLHTHALEILQTKNGSRVMGQAGELTVTQPIRREALKIRTADACAANP